MAVNQTYFGDYLAIYTNIESLSCTSETNVRSYVNYISKKDSIQSQQWALIQ